MSSFTDHRIIIASLFLPTSTAVAFHPQPSKLTPISPVLPPSASPTASFNAHGIDTRGATRDFTSQKSPTASKFNVSQKRPTHSRQNTLQMQLNLSGQQQQPNSIIDEIISAQASTNLDATPSREKGNPFASFATSSGALSSTDGKKKSEDTQKTRTVPKIDTGSSSDSVNSRGREGVLRGNAVSISTSGLAVPDPNSSEPSTPMIRRLSRKQSKPTINLTLTRESSLGPWEIETNPNANGGLHNAVKSIEHDFKQGKHWVGVLGPETDDISLEMRRDIEERMSDRDSIPVWVKDNDFSGCYDDFCHQVLWPSLHYIIPDAPKTKVMYESSSFIQYKSVNEAFADKICSIWREGDIIWVNDYHLMLLPQLLRTRLPKAAIGFFLHVAFPSSEIFRCLAARESLLRGMLGADLIGFQTHSYARHFRQTVSRILSMEATPKGVQILSGPNLKPLMDAENLPFSPVEDDCTPAERSKNHGHPLTMLEKLEIEIRESTRQTLSEHSFVDVGVFPMGIDVQSLTQKRKEKEVEEWVHALRDRYKGMKMIVARDKLDEVQGVRQKFLAFERFLEQNSEYQGKVMLIQVALSTSFINELQGNAMDVVARINMKFSTLTYQPIIFFHTHDLTFAQYLALLTVADCFIVTSMREGMALRTHEYVECQSERKRPLILSEFTGSYSFSGFRTCLPINPWDIQMTADAIVTSLTMSDEEAEAKWTDLHNHVNTQTAQAFATSFLARTLRVNYKHHIKDSLIIPALDTEQIKERYRCPEGGRRLILLDLERTLWPIDTSPPPQSIEVPEKAMQLLKKLCADEKNEVWALSGLPIKGRLETIAKNLPMLGICAEHGCFIKPRGSDIWITMIKEPNLTWMVSCMEILQYFTERTSSSFIDKRQATIVWRCLPTDDEAERTWARRQAAEAQNHIYDSLGERFGLRIIPSLSSFIILPKVVGRTSAVAAILNPEGIKAMDIRKTIPTAWPTPDMGETERFEYILAVGSDESLMNRLKRVKNAETIYTGLRKSGGSNWRCGPEAIYEAFDAILQE
ncbi:hypothetical protein FRC14_002463 [Serendipita sp. 396]|nr:hypothetical protein FRC14_002463 [Serendipita sp. 396]KAG8827389.1 hypothetical protein FRC19_003538 [Serendipita sp. 401]KAG9057888.1 hypothetical protein FS842_003208 [Serendipita sp. 407]